MIKKIFKFVFFTILFLAICALFSYKYYLDSLESAIGESEEKKVFVVEEGVSAYEVLSELKTQQFINDTQEFILKVYIKLGNIPEIKEGTFKIPFNLPLKDLLTYLENPELTDIWITIPEGLRKDEIAKIIGKEFKGLEGAVFSEKEFLEMTEDKEYIQSLGLKGTKNLEGYLFPDKYLMPVQATTDYVIRTLISTFIERSDGLTYQQLIIASMIEREGLNNTDRPQISDVIRKRLEDGWLLQIDATMLYYYKDWKHVITQADKELDQPYNTYKRAGLPPTPICNPGQSSIQAAKNPKKNPYYFYIHDNSGNVYFATTLAEHEANIAKYLR